jgi:ABC-type nitrate/sulfonate/bicarbonate transport system permease component
MTRQALVRMAGSVAVTAALIALWQLCANAGLISPVFFPGPDRSFGRLWQQLQEAEFWSAFAQTLRRMALGFLLASLVGVAAGAAIGLSDRLRAYLEPTLEFIRPLPASAVIPLFVLLLGLNDRMIVSVIAFASLWPVLLATVQGFKTVEARLIDVARILHLSPPEYVRKIALPHAMPDIFAGLRLALTISLILAVVTEMLSGAEGLGHNIIIAARSFRAADLYAGVIVLGLIGCATNIVLERLELHVLRWRSPGASATVS